MFLSRLVLNFAIESERRTQKEPQGTAPSSPSATRRWDQRSDGPRLGGPWNTRLAVSGRGPGTELGVPQADRIEPRVPTLPRSTGVFQIPASRGMLSWVYRVSACESDTDIYAAAYRIPGTYADTDIDSRLATHHLGACPP